MAEKDEIMRQLCEVLRKHAGDGIELAGETELATDLGLDSAQVMEMLLEVEEKFDVSVPLNVLPDVQTINDLAQELEKLLNAAE